jgi:hypothetical protein
MKTGKGSIMKTARCLHRLFFASSPSTKASVGVVARMTSLCSLLLLLLLLMLMLLLLLLLMMRRLRPSKKQ